MRHDRNHFRRQHNGKGFDEHVKSSFSGGKAGALRKRRNWRFCAVAALDFEPHVRMTARTMALPGKHMRVVEESARAAHGKNS